MSAKAIYGFVLCCLCGVFVHAQSTVDTVRHSPYILDAFARGKVLLKTGSSSEETLNYNALTGEMIFDAGGKYLAIGNPAAVDTVIIEARKFIPVNNKFYEWLPGTPDPLFIEYTYTVTEPGTEIGYGMSSSTMAAQGLTSLIKAGGAYKLKLPDGYRVVPGFTYWIYKDNNYQKAGNVQQLSKIYPGKKHLINDWVKKTNTRFSNREEVVTLLRQVLQ
jgi:hypothetical protein